MNLTLKKAIRSKIPLRIALIGPSGSGKTYSALRLARGITQVAGGAVFLLDTEKGRGRVYANEFEYFYEEFAEPHSPERYVEYLKAVEATGQVRVLIIDSAFHEWEYLLGVLATLKDKNDFTKWDKITPRHWAFVKGILASNMHVIVNLRGKDQYVLEEKGGKQVPRKKGLGPQFRPGFEYECNVSFLLDREGNTATADKDDTHRYREGEWQLTEEDGVFLAKWADSGESFIAHPEPVLPGTPAAASSSAPAGPTTAATPAPAPRLERPTDIELKGWMKGLSTATDLDVLKSIWENIQGRVKLCGAETIARFQGVKEARKMQLEDLAQRTEPHLPARPADSGAGLFTDQGQVRPEPPPAPVVPADERTADQLEAEGNYVSYIRSAKLKKTLEGLSEAIQADRAEGRLIESQVVRLTALIEEQRTKLSAGAASKKPAAVAA